MYAHGSSQNKQAAQVAEAAAVMVAAVIGEAVTVTAVQDPLQNP
jgi:hypothetical protein